MALNTSDPKFQKALLIVLLVAGACYGYFSYIFGPKQEAVKKADSELSAVERNLSAAQAIVQSSDTLMLLQELEKRRDDLALVETLLPDRENLAGLLERVTRLGELSGVNFALFEPQTPIQHEIYQEQPYRVTLRGGYHQAAGFLSAVASLDQIVKPTGVSLVRDTRDNTGPSETLTAEMTLTTYLMIPAAKGAPAKAKGGGKK